MRNDEWKLRAKCRGESTDKFDLDVIGLRYNALRDYANQVCRGCPVMAQCAADALRQDDRGVIRGGEPLSLTTHKRFLVRRLQFVVLNGHPEEKRGDPRRRKPKQYGEKDRQRQRKYQQRRKIERWQDRRCQDCGVLMKSATMDEGVWPDRVVGHTHLVCVDCHEIASVKSEDDSYREIA